MNDNPFDILSVEEAQTWRELSLCEFGYDIQAEKDSERFFVLENLTEKGILQRLPFQKGDEIFEYKLKKFYKNYANQYYISFCAINNLNDNSGYVEKKSWEEAVEYIKNCADGFIQIKGMVEVNGDYRQINTEIHSSSFAGLSNEESNHVFHREVDRFVYRWTNQSPQQENTGN